MSEAEFDDSFLADFDVDAAVHAYQGIPSSGSPDANPAHSSKRLKVTPSPSAGIAGRSFPAKQNSPFPPNSKFSTGHHLDPASETPMTPIVAQSPAPITQTPAPSLTSNAGLEATLQKYFGFSKFRPGQVEVIQSILQQKDAAVFWATGSGKSLCYQIPPLHTGEIGLIVTPLISLMQDQVSKLNGLSQQRLATFLGSAQSDASEQDKALAGQYPFIYVTPEKLLSPHFLDSLAYMHQHVKRLSLIAVDESHCVSEWGHDFRPEYRKLHQLRDHHILRHVPLLALTATAVPTVQTDILSSLQLHEPYLARQSFDRHNLQISVHRKAPGAFRAALDPLLSQLQQDSTIIYAATRDQVDDITSYLQGKLPAVEAYHAGLSAEKRSQAHTNFLVGQTKVIVATVAFGMGIDKTDTRRVIHYGPPKTVEEYYQQIGRAGRDGRPADCIMFVSEGDFDRYKSDFYVGGLTGDVKRFMMKSMDALRRFSFDTETCRRKAVLEFFQETPSFGERCGTCDNCQRHAKYGGDSERDLGNLGARVILAAIDFMQDQGLSTIEKVIGGNKVDDYRYRTGADPSKVQEYIQHARRDMQKKFPISHFRELVAPLVTKGYIEQGNKQTSVNGRSRSWTVYKLTSLGRDAIRNPDVSIVLPVPPSMREAERKEAEKRQRVLAQLDEAGVKLDLIPMEERESGDGEVIRAFSKWHGYLEALRRNGKDERLRQLEDLLGRIEKWRLDAASTYRMAPSAVLAEHIMVFIAYTVASMKPGYKVQEEALIAAGVRTREIDSLIRALNQWVDEAQPGSATAGAFAVGARMTFPENDAFTPANAWEFAVYKPAKKTGLASWESSYQRFLRGEHPQTIAMSPANGRPIQVTTVVSHILDGLTLGHPVPLHQLAKVLPPPTKSEWEQMQDAEKATGLSVMDNPSKFTKTEFLRPIMGDEFTNTPYNDRTEKGKAEFGRWCDLLNWYMALRRVGYEPAFSD